MDSIVEFSISGGELLIDKKVFVREMLKPQSLMKKLLNYSLKDGDKSRSLHVDKSSTDRVVIDFNFVDNVKVGGDYDNLLKDLKGEYMESIKGEVILTAFYYSLMTIHLDLNSENGEIKIISR